MSRSTVLLVFAVACALPAAADEYWVSYQGNDFPENEGWTRTFSDKNGVFGQGGAIRTFENGALVLDSLRSVMIVDFYEMSRPIDPDPGELFIMRWRLKIDSVPGHRDPGVGVFADAFTGVSLEFSETNLFSRLEQTFSANFEPDVFHVFELRSYDMAAYELSIDGTPALIGRFMPIGNPSRVAWGDVIQGGTSVTRWDYFEFGVVPEPSALLCILSGSLPLLAKRRKPTLLRSKS
ncbi:MAG: hypothetical protein IH986_10445 [Planctomycetes bacterium]|nr:hypothetical protein [Planctomycetota bacterium]